MVRSINKSVCSPTVRIIAFQAIDPGSTPGRRIDFVFYFHLGIQKIYYVVGSNNSIYFFQSHAYAVVLGSRVNPPRPAADRIIFSIQKLDPHNPQTKTFISAPAPPKPAGNPPNPRVILIILKIVILIKNDYFLII